MAVAEYCGNCDKRTLRKVGPCPECTPENAESQTTDAQQLKAEICSTCGYFPCVNRKQFEGTIITHCTQYYKLSAV